MLNESYVHALLIGALHLGLLLARGSERHAIAVYLAYLLLHLNFYFYHARDRRRFLALMWTGTAVVMGVRVLELLLWGGSNVPVNVCVLLSAGGTALRVFVHSLHIFVLYGTKFGAVESDDPKQPPPAALDMPYHQVLEGLVFVLAVLFVAPAEHVGFGGLELPACSADALYWMTFNTVLAYIVHYSSGNDGIALLQYLVRWTGWPDIIITTAIFILVYGLLGRQHEETLPR